MISIAVCDDDAAFLGLIHDRIHEYFQCLRIPVKIDLFSNAGDFWKSFLARPYHIVFLDIIMPNQTGIDLARQVYRHDRACVIAFLTSSPDFAIQGYGVNAVGYVLKPAGDEELAELFGKCLLRHYETRPSSILLRIGGVNQKIETASIIYLESKNKQVLINLDDATLAFSGKLSDIIGLLPPHFVQTHKSYIVNLERVTSMTRDEMVAENGIKIPTSRQYHKNASKRYLDHVSGEV